MILVTTERAPAAGPMKHEEVHRRQPHDQDGKPEPLPPENAHHRDPGP